MVDNFNYKKSSLCYNVMLKGWVSREDYEDDVEASEMWPQSLRDMYYRMSTAMVAKAYATRWGTALFFVCAYLYIISINGVDAAKDGRLEAWRLVAWIPFLIWLIPAFCAGYMISRGDND